MSSDKTRSTRETTKEKTEKSKLRALKKSKVSEVNKDSFDDEVARLEETLGIVDSEGNPLGFEENQELVWDHSADKESPTLQVGEFDEVFEEITQLSSFGCDDTIEGPLPPHVDQQGVIVYGNDKRSLSISVNRVEVGAEEVRSPNFPSRETVFNIPEETEVNNLERLPAIEESDKMDLGTYQDRLKEVKKLVRQSKTRIDSFTMEDVSLVDRETYLDRLLEIRTKVEPVTDKLDDLIEDLEETSELDRVAEVNDLKKTLVTRLKANEKSVKEEMAKIIKENDSQAGAASPASVTSHSSVVSSGGGTVVDKDKDQTKVLLRVKHLDAKVVTLTNKVTAVPEPTQMYDPDIREHLNESKVWEKTKTEIIDVKNKIEEDSVGLALDLTEILEKVSQMEIKVEQKINGLKSEDKKRGLFSLADSKSKEAVVFPPSFGGKVGENVFKFRKDFSEAIVANQVREADRVKRLRNNLHGEAKAKIGDHYKNLEEALEALTQYFGNPQLILQKTVSEYEKSVSNFVRDWGMYGSNERVMAVARTLEFIRQITVLAEDFPELANEVYSSNTTKLLYKVMPRDYVEKINDDITDVNITESQKIDKIKTVLEKKRVSALLAQSGLEQKKKTGPQMSSNVNSMVDDHDCSKSRECQRKWGKLGCVELYKLSSAKERKTYLFSLKMCFKCGESFKAKPKFNPNNSSSSKPGFKPHVCYWPKEKLEVTRCTADNCEYSAAVCSLHEQISNASPKLIDWLNRVGVQHNMFTIGLSLVKSNKVVSNPKKKQNVKRPKVDDAKIDYNSSDQELMEYLKVKLGYEAEDQGRVKVGPVSAIPEGRGMFVFSVFKGKTRDLQCFHDSGCDGFVAEDGVPQNDLVSVMIDDQPAPLGVASGITVHSTGEYGCLLPLEDGSHQVVRGLTLPKVTATMPKFKLQCVFKQIQKQHPGNSLLQEMTIPPVLGSKVHMILGQKYNLIHPEPVQRMPNGLVVYRSKLLPTVPGQLACIGGPVEVLNGLCQNMESQIILNHMVTMCGDLENYKPRMEYFPFNPDSSHRMIPGSVEFVEDVSQGKACGPDALEETKLRNVTTTKDLGVSPGRACGPDALEETKLRNVTTTADLCVSHGSARGLEAPEKDKSMTGGKNIVVPRDCTMDVKDGSSVSYAKKCGDCGEKFIEEDPPGQSCKGEPELGREVLVYTMPPAPSQALKVCHSSKGDTVTKKLRNWLKVQELGFDTGYKCPTCRSCKQCLKGSGFERMSLQQEVENQLIKDSVIIDRKRRMAVARLPFLEKPEEKLTENKKVAIKRLDNVMRKYASNVDNRAEMMKVFQKFRDKGHLLMEEELTEEQLVKVYKSGVGYTIPWDIVFKPDSLSTPLRPVFDASACTPNGTSLNNILAKGDPELINLVGMLLGWMMGKVGLVGDISQFYPAVHLHEDDWKYQKIVMRENMDPKGNLINGVICKLIFGVRPVGSQTEEVIRKLAEELKDEDPVANGEVIKLLLLYRYVDDMMKGVQTIQEALILMEKAEEALGQVEMLVKGWSMSGEKPPESLSKDGASVGVCGFTWYPVADIYRLNISSLFIGKKKRGQIPKEILVFDGKMSMEQFVPSKITRREVTSIVARIWDPLGKLTPLTVRFKRDLRRMIAGGYDWDSPISAELRTEWLHNFQLIEDVRDILYARCSLPVNAKRSTCRLLVMCDAAEQVVVNSVYVGYEKQDNSYSCSQLFGRGVLATTGRTIAQNELQGLSNGADLVQTMMNFMEEWIEEVYLFADSEIALSWVLYEKAKLQVFHQNRVINIRSKINLNNLFWVDGKVNCADIGTRPELVSASSVRPGSPWLDGHPWMKHSLEKAEAEGAIKSAELLKLTNDAKKTFKEGVVCGSPQDMMEFFGVVRVNTVNKEKLLERELKARYLYSPLNGSFVKVVRVTALVIKAVKKFKSFIIKKDCVEKSMEDSLGIKFSLFNVFSSGTRDYSGNICPLLKSIGSNGRCHGAIKEKDINESLSYLYRKASIEVKSFNDKKTVEKLCLEYEGVLLCRQRLLEEQQLRVVGEVEEYVNLESLVGVSYRVPVLDRHSPLALCIARHLHYTTYNHSSVDSMFRLSLKHVRILGGKQLFRSIEADCIRCKIVAKKCIKQLMGPLADSQINISPIFYATYVDLYGPLTIFVPGYAKVTRRSNKKPYEGYLMVFACASTGTVNIQLIEGKTTSAVLDGFSRLFSEVSVPKIILPDEEGSFMKALKEGEIEVQDLAGTLERQKGITFSTCPPQGHYQHGRVERRIGLIAKCLEKSGMQHERNTATGWMTIAKVVEREINSVPLGYLQHQRDGNSALLRILSPNSLKLATNSARSPRGLFTIPDSPDKLMARNQTLFNLWWKVWTMEYLPRLADMSKWTKDSPNLTVNDVVLFKLTESKMHVNWRYGKIEEASPGRDGKVRVVTVAYRSDINKETPHIAVVRPVGSVVKLFNIKDTSMILEMERVRDLARRMLNGESNNSSEVCGVSKPNMEGELGRDVLVYTTPPAPSHPHKTSRKGTEYKLKSEVIHKESVRENIHSDLIQSHPVGVYVKGSNPDQKVQSKSRKLKIAQESTLSTRATTPTSKADEIYNLKPEVREKGTVLLNYFEQGNRVGTEGEGVRAERSEANNSLILSNYDNLILL